MDVFTDASLNERKKIAGVSAVFVPSQVLRTVTSYNSYCSVGKIETAELFAIAMALSLIASETDETVRVVSDSRGALRKIQRIFHYPDQRQIHTIKDLMQKRILYNISFSFSKMYEKSFSFCCIHGHQHKAEEASDAYYNAIADQEALMGRVNGEDILHQEQELDTGISRLSAEERVILNQQDCLIVSPKQISFHYDGGVRNQPKPIAHKHLKNQFIRIVCKFGRRR